MKTDIFLKTLFGFPNNDERTLGLLKISSNDVKYGVEVLLQLCILHLMFELIIRLRLLISK